MSDTPRTDERVKFVRGGGSPDRIEHLCRELERELAAANKQLAEFTRLINDDGGLNTFEQHRDILIDAMGALNAAPMWAEENNALKTALAAANKRADEAERDAKLLREQNAQLTDLNQEQFLKLEYLMPIYKAAKALSDEAQEYDFDDGLGQGALQECWDELNAAFEPKTEAIAEVLKNG